MMHGDNNNPFSTNEKFSVFFNKDFTEFKIDKANIQKYIDNLQIDKTLEIEKEIISKLLNLVSNNQKFNNIKSINLDYNLRNEDDFKNIIKIIQQNPMDEINISRLISSKNRKHLLEILQDKVSLKKISIGNIGYSDESGLIALLEKLNLLQVLILNNCSLITEDNFIEKLSEVLQKSKVKVLHISGQELSTENIKALAELIRNNKQIEKIYLKDVELSKEHIEILGEAFKESSIKVLDFSNNNFNEIEKVQALSDLIKNGKSLEELILTDENFSEGSVKILNEALKDKIKKLNLCHSFNSNLDNQNDYPITIEELKDLVNNNKLKNLNLDRSFLPEEHMNALFEELENNNTLEHLDLSNSFLSFENLSKMADLIKCNKTIKSLDISSSVLDLKGIELVSEALKENKSILKLKLPVVLSRKATSEENAEYAKIVQEINRSLDDNRKILQSAGEFTAMVLSQKRKQTVQQENSLFNLPVDVLAEIAKFVPANTNEGENYRNMVLGRKPSEKQI